MLLRTWACTWDCTSVLGLLPESQTENHGHKWGPKCLSQWIFLRQKHKEKKRHMTPIYFFCHVAADLGSGNTAFKKYQVGPHGRLLEHNVARIQPWPSQNVARTSAKSRVIVAVQQWCDHCDPSLIVAGNPAIEHFRRGKESIIPIDKNKSCRRI